MKITLQWLEELTGLTFSVDELAETLTMLGHEVEEISSLVPDLTGVIVGKVLEVEPVPKSHHLKKCLVDVGSERLQIVCGADNVAAGQHVPVATVGTTLPAGMTIRKAKLMGVESRGMICSEAELGLSNEASGIMVLNSGAETGMPFANLLGEDDTILELAITPNRPDCFGAIGIARDICAQMNVAFNPPERPHVEQAASGKDVTISLQDQAGCPRYTARVIRGVTVGPSPEWLARRMQALGLRSISNIVDATNYVMYLTGQPLHAFDNAKLNGGIIVRRAKQGEKFVTLDEIERELSPNNLLICDEKQPVAIAGVMGGLNSEVSDDTTEILLESAYFDPKTIRLSAKHVGLSTDASKRFERGVDPNGVDYASDLATHLIIEIAGGEVVSPLIDAYPELIAPVVINFRPERARKIAGHTIDEKTMLDILSRLSCGVSQKDASWEVTAPSFRPDLTREIDLIEEIIRIFGYNEIPVAEYDWISLRQTPNAFAGFLEKIRSAALNCGMTEAITIGMVSRQQALPFVDDETQLFQITNPLGEDMGTLRPSVFASLLGSIAYNINRRQKQVHLFETGSTFLSRGPDQAPDEKLIFAGLFYGKREQDSWVQKSPDISFYDVKGKVQYALKMAGIKEIRFEIVRLPHMEYAVEVILSGERRAGYLGKLRKKTTNLFDIEGDVFGFELDTSVLHAAAGDRQISYKAVSRYPAVERDIAVVVSKEYAAGDVAAVIRKTAGTLLQNMTLFDVYEGAQVPEGKVSLAFSLTFQSDQGTLKEEQVDDIMASILRRLEKEFTATLRQ